MKFAMAEKRAATSELNHLNWDKEEESEKSGTFQTASVDELKSRVIKKARRKIGASSDGDENKTVFSGFSGFKNTSAATSVTSTASPFSFLNKISSTAPSTSSDNLMSEKSENTTFNSPITKNGNHKSVKDYSKLKDLNQAVADWIKKHVEENPICILTPIFKDYENYLKEILENENDSKKEIDKVSNKGKWESSSSVTSISSSKSEEQPKLFNFINKDNKNKEKASEVATSPGKGFSFATDTKTVTEPGTLSSSSSIFANIKPPSSTNIFGSPGSFQFGKTQTATSTTSTVSPTKGFSFTNTKPFSFAGNVTGQSASSTEDHKTTTAEDDDNEEPPKNDFKAVVEEDNIYSKRCKVYVKNDGNYAERGVGTLYLKPIKESGKTQLLVRADTNLGNILLNFILSKGLPSQRMGKNNVMIVCVPTPESEPKPTSVLLRVKSSEEADELLEIIKKYKK